MRFLNIKILSKYLAPAKALATKFVHSRWFIFLTLFFLILIFYWSFTAGVMYPAQDGALPISYYAHLYTGYLNYGEYFLTNTFSYTEDLITSYVFMGASPFDPVLRVWFFISQLLNLSVLTSFWWYLIIYITFGTIAVYILGETLLFKNKSSSFYLAVVFSMSGYFVSSTSIPSFIIPFAWLPVILLLSLSCFKYQRLGDYYLLSLGLSILITTYITLGIGISLYCFLFILPFLLNYWLNYKNRRALLFKRLVFFGGLSLFFNSVIFLVYIRYLNGSIRWLQDLKCFYVGIPPQILSSNRFIDWQWLFNIFMPSDLLATWNGYGNGSLWINSFYYLGIASFILACLGIVVLGNRKRYRLFATGLLIATMFAFFYAQGHPLPRMIPFFNTLTKYPHFSRPLIIFSALLLSAFGFNELFVAKNKVIKDLKVLSLKYFPALLILAALFLLLVHLSVGAKSKPDEIVYSLSYIFILGILYVVAMVSKRKKLFLSLLLFDLFFFLSSSIPLVDYPHKRTLASITAVFLNSDRSFKIPQLQEYSVTKPFPGMHFGASAVYSRQSHLPSPETGFMLLRRTALSNKEINDTFISGKQRFNALSMLGVSKTRYFVAPAALMVDQYEDLYPKLSLLYEELDREKPWQGAEPVVVVGNDHPLLAKVSGEYGLSDTKVTIHTDYEEYLSSFSRDNQRTQVTLEKEYLVDVGRGVYKFTGELPVAQEIVTEGISAERLCLLVEDAGGNYYYPLSGDIFNFDESPPEGEPANKKYMVPNNYFYASYLETDGEASFFIRRPTNQPGLDLEDLILFIKDPCYSPFTGSDDLREEKVVIPSSDFVFEKDFKNTVLAYYTGVLTNTELPSYFGKSFNRVTVTDLEGRKIDWFEEHSNQEASFELEDQVLRILLDYYANPVIASPIQVNFSVIDKKPYPPEIEIVNETPDQVLLKVRSEEPSIVVARRVFEPDWKVFVDGEKEKVFSVNGLYLGVEMPAGDHEIKFEYKPFWLGFMKELVPVYAIVIPVLILILRGRSHREQDS